MENKNSYFIAGLFFCIVLAMLTFFVLYMNIKGNEGETRYYYIETKELPNGIKNDSQVRFIGVPAGIVKDIYFSDPKSATIEIKMSLKKDLPIKQDSVAVVEVQGISGIAYINISKGSDSAEVFSPNDKPIIKMGQGLLAKIGDSAINLGSRIDASLSKIDRALSDENLNNLSNSIASLNTILSNLAKVFNEQNSNNINKLLENSVTISNRVSAIKFEELNKNAADFLNIAKKSAKSFEDTQTLLMSKLSSGEYDFKSFLTPTLSATNDTLLQLDSLIMELKNTLFRLEDNPYEFFFKDTSGDKK
ncbi:MlaD family protein [Campylobacter fetus]|uniref:MlaD family protein n=1 Tax=Campylobacter fetus TaxID=196 RepID=UPI000FCB88A8|nr:MlaD family protein [Campylobacter fetus]QQF51316.1 MCE family protein [Campylobacter fetus subsp. venerealis]RUT48884.1 mammalian cell entry protein [Campylobacter fetus]RUT49006.1 mammalian cell entry protein [Campylobacter fetus]